jgi:hypothetical protein
MWLTGRAGGPALGCFSGVTAVMDRAARTLGELTRRAGRAVMLDGPALLGERAALSGLTRRGEQSCGGSSRLLRSTDSWIAISLVRPADVELLPAWLGVAASADPWPAVASAVATRAGAELVQSGAELGLAVARLGERQDDRAAVVAIRLGEAAPAPLGTRRRVVDLSSLWAGPLAGQLLAAAGMDVVKVESITRPDGAREGTAAFNDLLNADKASVALDFSTREGVGALRRLLLSADVVIEASRPRALEQLGVDAAQIVATGSTRVWLSITGHGRTEPHRHRVGFGDDAAVAGGLVARDSRGAMFCADAVADPATGLLGATAVVERLTGGGRWVLDAALARTAALMATGEPVAWDGEVSPPRSRSVAGKAAPLGRDTRRVLAALGGTS